MLRIISLLALSGLLLVSGCGTNASTSQNPAVGMNAAMSGFDDAEIYYAKMSNAMERTFGYGNITKDQVINHVNSGSIHRISNNQDKQLIFALFDIANNSEKWKKMDSNKDGLLNAREVEYYGSVPHVGGW